MTPALRKYHRRLWFFMAGFLPVLFVAAIAVIPDPKPDVDFGLPQPEALPLVLKTAETEQFTAYLRRAETSDEHQVEVQVKKPLTTPAALVYWAKNEKSPPKEGILLGSLGPQGTYRFNLGGTSLETTNYLLLFDPVKNRPIQTLEL